MPVFHRPAEWMSRLHVILGGFAVLATAVVFAIGSRPDVAPHPSDRVTARVGGDSQLQFDPPAPATSKVKIGSSTRTAFSVPPNSSLETAIAPGARTLIVSMGAPNLAANERAQFLIFGEGRFGWQRLAADTLGPLRPGWVNRAVDLSQVRDRPITRLRFETRSEPPGEKEGPELFWGSIILESSALPPRSWFWTSPPDDSSPTSGLILISLDTLRADQLGALGGPPDVSPNIDKFLRDSFSFGRAYAQYPNTPVSHASLFTGLYPHHHGVYETSPWLKRNSLASILAGHGYFTAAITENAYVSSDFGFDLGFDWYDNGVSATTNADDDLLGTAAVTFKKAKTWLTRYGHNRRFFLFLHTYEVHAPYVPKDKEAWAYVDKINPGYEGPFKKGYPGGLSELIHNTGHSPLSEDDLRRVQALYLGEVNHLDRVFNDFLAFLRRSFPEGKRPLVVVFSDHGEEFGEHGKLGHGETLHGQALHVPLAFHQPGIIPPGESNVNVELVDVLPTILDLLDIPADERFDGATLGPLIFGEESLPPDRAAHAELKTAWGDCRRLGLDDRCRVNRLGIRTDRFSLITSAIPSGEHLYDLASDPQELHDVSESHGQELADLRDRLAAYAGEGGESGHAGTPELAEPEIDEATRDRLRALGYHD